MSAVIHKYPLISDRSVIATSVDIDLPPGSKVVHVAEQNGVPTIWVEKWAERLGARETVTHRFRIIATGETVNAGRYVGTVHIGAFVFHIYEEMLG